MKRLIPAVAAALVTVVIGSPAYATFPGADGKIAFGDSRSGRIYSINPDGASKKQLTTGGRRADDPQWSPSGGRIAYITSAHKDDPKLQIMNAGGGSPKVILEGSKRHFRTMSSPTWSPTGGRIAFCATGKFGTRIFAVDQDGTNLANLSGAHRADCDPDWAPDGSKIVFRFQAGKGWALAKMDPDGTSRKTIVASGVNVDPSYAPNSALIAFDRRTGKGKYDIAEVSPTGSGLRMVTKTKGRWEYAPAWSPAGDMIVFPRSIGGARTSPADLWVMNPDGTHPDQITNSPGSETTPSWQRI